MDMTGLIRTEEASARAGISRSTFLALVAKGQAPQPLRFNPVCSLYREAEIEIWRKSYVGQRQHKKRSHMARAPR